MLPPLAVIVTLLPSQTLVEVAVAVTMRSVDTVMVIVAEEVQPLEEVPVTVYSVVEAGLASTEAPVVEERSVAGLQTYVEAPLAINVVVSPEQIEGSVAVGFKLITVTFTVTVELEVHPLAAVPVTVYVVVEVGVAVTDEPVVPLNPVEGFHT